MIFKKNRGQKDWFCVARNIPERVWGQIEECQDVYVSLSSDEIIPKAEWDEVLEQWHFEDYWYPWDENDPPTRSYRVQLAAGEWSRHHHSLYVRKNTLPNRYLTKNCEVLFRFTLHEVADDPDIATRTIEIKAHPYKEEL